MRGHSMRENREILCLPAEVGRDAPGRPRPYADDERAEEVGQARSVRWAAHWSEGLKSLRRSNEERRIQRRG
jgi:hypothetical protein